MKKLALAVLFAAVAALAACGGGGDDDVEIVDSGPIVEDQCDPVAQTGCAEGEKCAHLVIAEEPEYLARTECVPNGTAAIGEGCAEGAPGETSGFDDCAAEAGVGAQCVNGICREICAIPGDTCAEGFACSFYEDLFADLEVDDSVTGVCDEVCDPIAQDCSLEADACYLDPRRGRAGVATCAGLSEEAATLTQGLECFGPGEGCYLNGCAEGYHPIIIDIPPEGGAQTCTAYCQPVDTYIVDPEGDGKGEPVGNAVGFDDEDPKTPPVDCSADRIGAIDHHCRSFQLLVDQQGELLDYIPADVGFCLDALGVNLEFYGDCAQTRYERQFKAFDEGYPDPKTLGNDARDAYCTDFPDHCGAFCVSAETFSEIGDAYCTANKASPICEPVAAAATGARRANMWRVHAGRGIGAPLAAPK